MKRQTYPFNHRRDLLVDCSWGESLYRSKYLQNSSMQYTSQSWMAPHWGATLKGTSSIWTRTSWSTISPSLCSLRVISFLEWAEISLDAILPTVQSAEIRWENMCKDVVAHRAEITRRDSRGFFLVPVRTSHSWFRYLYQTLPSCYLSALLLLSDWELSHLRPGALVLMFSTLTFILVRLLRT